jgi:hypothetical protein
MSQEPWGAAGWQGPCLRLRGWLARYLWPGYDQARFIEAAKRDIKKLAEGEPGTALAVRDDRAFAAAVLLRYPPGLPGSGTPGELDGVVQRLRAAGRRSGAGSCRTLAGEWGLQERFPARRCRTATRTSFVASGQASRAGAALMADSLAQDVRWPTATPAPPVNC